MNQRSEVCGTGIVGRAKHSSIRSILSADLAVE
nr:MAG TPA: hypothetical protein [Caudoviricetes sp.]